MLRYGLFIKEIILITTAIMVGVASTSVTAYADAVTFECNIYSVFPDSQCSSSHERVSFRTEFGRFPEDEYQRSTKVFIEGIGPSESNPFTALAVTVESAPAGAISTSIERSGSGLTLVPGAEELSNLAQKQSIVVIAADSGIRDVTIDARSKSKQRNGGDVIIIADSLDSLSVDVSGYAGLDGKSQAEALGIESVAGGASSRVPGGIAANFIETRLAEPQLPLEFLASDLDAYESNGLTCRDDEIAVGGPGSYSFDHIYDGSEPSPLGMNIVAAKRQESKRAFCRRKAEYVVSQECAAEQEFSFQAVCRVRPESRSFFLSNRNRVVWERAICAQSFESQIRRKIVRTAFVNIVIPGVKSFTGQVTREIKYSDTYNVYRRKAQGESGSLAWVNPFWKQSASLPPSDTIEISTGISVDNAYTSELSLPPANGQGYQQGVKVTYIPKQNNELSGNDVGLFSFKANAAVTTIDPSLENGEDSYTVSGCAAVADLSSGKFKNINKKEKNDESKYPVLVEFFSAFNSLDFGFSKNDLKNASVIEVRDCFAYEAMDAIAPADSVKANWALASGVADESITNPPEESVCPELYENRVGTETLIQYEREDSCYVTNPSNPPYWLKRKKIIDDSLPLDADDEDAVNGVEENAFKISELSANFWNQFTDDETPKSTDSVVDELNFPESVSLQEIQLIKNQNHPLRTQFCVAVDSGQPDNLTNTISLAVLVRAKADPKFVIRQGDETATPSGTINYSCPAGVRLDKYLSQVVRPTCPEGSSTKMRMSRWSNEYGDSVWTTYSDSGQLAAPDNYILRNEYSESRYDDLPSQIFTSRTHSVDSALSIDSSESLTSEAFPPSYGFETNDGGLSRRSNPGWLRESYLKNDSGVSYSPNNFTPVSGNTLFERSEKWCNLDAFKKVGNNLVTGFGAKGILRDAPKRVFSFDLESTEYQSVGAPVKTIKKYVGIEIVTASGKDGFFGSGVFDTTEGALWINSSLTTAAFKTANYPYIGSRFRPSCNVDEKYNELTGFCHDPLSPGVPSNRLAYRVKKDDTRDSWSFFYTKAELSHELDYVELPFNGQAQPTPTGLIDLDVFFSHYFHMGMFRPSYKMIDNSTVSSDIFLNRPETVTKKVLSPGYLGDPLSQSGCASSFRMIAVPVPETPLPGDSSIEINTNNYLPADSILLAIDLDCEQDLFKSKATIRRLGLNGSNEAEVVQPNSLNSLNILQNRVVVEPGSERISFVLSHENSNELFKLSNIRESLVAGLSATTGHETLDIVEISSPLVRNRRAEWLSDGRSAFGFGWKDFLKTNSSEPSSDVTVQPLSCGAENTRAGIFAQTDQGQAITNGSVEQGQDCRLSNTCALTEEELSLFSKAVADSKSLVVTRSSVTQYTPWSHELDSSAPKDGSSSTSSAFGEWTITDSQTTASTPSCEIYDSANPGDPAENDRALVRSSFNNIEKYLDLDRYKIFNPTDQNITFMSVLAEPNLRYSDSCTRWDSIRGSKCEERKPTIEGSELSPLIFGGEWEKVFVETKERLAQDCLEFIKNSNNEMTADCKDSDSDPTNANPFISLAGSPEQHFCTPDSCVFPTNAQSFQVDASVPISGENGEDGTDAGSATIFCSDCGAINFIAEPGIGGQGSEPLSSSQSKILTCVSWNNNSIAPVFNVRNLWSQPFRAGNVGQNGRNGNYGGGIRQFRQMTEEAVYMLTQPNFFFESISD